MPEGPEVRIVRDFLRKHLKQINKIEVRFNKFYGFEKLVLPAEVANIDCKGKLLYFKVRNLWVINHMMLTGGWSLSEGKYDKVIFDTGSEKLYYGDARGFGMFRVLTEKELQEKLDSMGPDVLAGNLSLEYFQTLHKRRAKIANVISNSKFISGIGNYLRSEILEDAKIHPCRVANSLTAQEILRLYDSVIQVANKFYIGGGSIKYAKKMGWSGGVDFVVYGKGNKIKMGSQYIWTSQTV